jgi:hypothetical protein
MLGNTWRPRVNIDVSPETFRSFQKIPHGMKRVILGILMDAIAKELETDRAGFLTKVLSREIDIEELLGLQTLENGEEI